jgi:hypothetical protein
MSNLIFSADHRAWYKRHFGPFDQRRRYYPDFYDRWSFAKDEVDPEIIVRFEHLARGNVKRLASRLWTNLSLDTIYRCVNGDSVGDDVAIEFETAFGNHLWSPNFDTPPCPPSENLEDLNAWIKEHVGTRGWIAEQLGISETAVGNALHGRSKAIELRIRGFCADFYQRRLDMDVRIPGYEEAKERYERDLQWRAYRFHEIAGELYARSKERWDNSPEKRELDARVRGVENRIAELNRLRDQGVDESTDMRGFESWCCVSRDLIAREAEENGFEWLEKPMEWDLAPLGKRLNP